MGTHRRRRGVGFWDQCWGRGRIRDWQPAATARQIARNVLTAVRPGSIIELRDRGATVAALPAIVRGIRRRGLHLVALTANPPTAQRATGNP